MTSDDISQLIRRDLDAFDYEPSPRNGLLGIPWSKERMAHEIDSLRQALIDPKLVSVALADHPRTSSTRSLWVVTRSDENGYVVVFDPDANRFGLATVGSTGPPETVGVWGDLVTTYAAR